MIWDALRGHRAQIDWFRRAIARGRMSHAYLFCGPAGIGKRWFARLLAQCLFCENIPDAELDACGECPSCRRMAADTHPDFLSVGCPEGKNVFPIELIAGANERRGREGLCYEMSLRPGAGDRKIAVLDDVELMSLECANAFLKTLEEPPDYATLILLSSDRDSLLPTIQSRCQAIRFAPLGDADLAAILQERGAVDTPEEAAEIAALSEGSLAIADQLADSGIRDLRGKVFAALAERFFPATPIAADVTAALENLGDTNAQRRGAVWIFRFCIAFYRQALRAVACAGDPESVPVSRFLKNVEADNEDALELVSTLIERTGEAIRQIDRSSPVSLCVHGLFDDLSRMSKPLAAK